MSVEDNLDIIWALKSARTHIQSRATGRWMEWDKFKGLWVVYAKNSNTSVAHTTDEKEAIRWLLCR